MSNELTKARQQLAQIRTYLRTGKPLPAIQALHSTLLIVLKNPLMKSEKDEFAHLLEDAIYSIMADPTVKNCIRPILSTRRATSGNSLMKSGLCWKAWMPICGTPCRKPCA